jgi:hypothetical protein
LHRYWGQALYAYQRDLVIVHDLACGREAKIYSSVIIDLADAGKLEIVNRDTLVRISCDLAAVSWVKTSLV